MFEFIKDTVISILIVILFVLMVYFGFIKIPKYIFNEVKKHEKTHAEWMQKVNNCVMNENYRPDCKLILYKDQQNAHRSSSTTSTTVMPVPIVVGR